MLIDVFAIEEKLKRKLKLSGIKTEFLHAKKKYYQWTIMEGLSNSSHLFLFQIKYKTLEAREGKLTIMTLFIGLLVYSTTNKYYC